MKKFELYMGIAMIIITTLLDVLFPIVVTYSASNLALVCIMSLLGYVGGYLLIDSFIIRVETTYYVKGYNDGQEDAASDVREVFNNNKK